MPQFAYVSIESAYPKGDSWDRAADELVDKLQYLQATINRQMAYQPTMSELMNLVYALEPEPILVEDEPESFSVEG